MLAILATLLLCLVIVAPSKASALDLSGVISPLVAKAHEIINSCGSVIISGVRPHARVAGTNRISLHASGHALDLKGNPSCIYAQLKGWPGGYSIDYARVRPPHVHLSLDGVGGREMGARFTHAGKQPHRYAKHHWQHRSLARI